MIFFKNTASVAFVIFLSTVSVVSCKTKKPTGDTNTPTEKISDEQELLRKIDGSSYSYSNLNIKFAANIKIGKDENSVRGKLKIRKDSCVWVSALPFGIEAARILATKNDAGLIYYLKKSYFQGGYDLLSAQIGYSLNYNMLEAILTGAPIFVADRNSYKLEDDRKNGYYFSPYEKNKFERIVADKELPADRATNVQALWFSTENSKLSKTILYDIAQKRYLEINYDKYITVGKDTMPSLINIGITTPKQMAVFVIEYNKIDADASEMEYPFTIPNSYTKMELK